MENSPKENLFDAEGQKGREDGKLFSDSEKEHPVEKIVADETSGDFWKVLLVDDEEDIHSVTRMALKGFTYKDKDIRFLHAYSASESRTLLTQHKDIALIFLDVVMETSHAGLDLVRYIRDELKNHFTQIVLRTGYPGQAPEREVIATYEINDYKTKTELTTFKLFTVTLACLRTYDSIMGLENLRRNLEHIVKERTAELERKNVRIMEMDQMKTRFFSNVSHEFRTPLTLIISPLEDMMVDGDMDAGKKDRLEMMHRNALRLLGLVNQLLDLSKIDAGSMKLSIMYSDLNKVLRMITRSFITLAERKGIEYHIRIPEDEMKCYFDRDKTEKILLNLLSNAFKYTPEHGRIICSATYTRQVEGTDTRQLELEVSDTGPGIPQEQLEKIFDRFYQVEDGWKKEVSGTGIGLSLTRELANLLHGEIRVESGIHRGSCFRVLLPVGKDHLLQQEYTLSEPTAFDEQSLIIKCGLSVTHREESHDMPNDAEETGKPIVLIVEDNPDVRKHLGESLAGEFITREAGNGRDGFDKAVALIPDLVLTDLMMPETDGLELCRMLKADERTSHVPVILLTAKAGLENKITGLETGADDYLTKPFHKREIIARVKNLIDQRNALKEKYGSQLSLEPAKADIRSVDDKFLERVRSVIAKNLSDCNFDVNQFCTAMGMSRMQLFRKLKGLLGQTPNELIRNLRLQQSVQLMRQNFGNIAEITYEVGFNNLSYFAKCFREKYGLLPSEYQKHML